MKNSIAIALCTTLLLTGCAGTSSSSEAHPEEYGPVVEEDTRTDEEKELAMIQGCINDYNINRIPEIEEYLNTQLHPLPLEVTSLPEISSLKDLSEEPDYLESTNVVYAGSYMVEEDYKIVFLIYEATGNSFWFNGRVLFQIDPDLVTYDNPDYAEYRTAITSLLAQEQDVLNWLYGLDLSLGEEGPFEGYYEVTSMGSYEIHSLDDIRAIAESIFTHSFLEENFYFSMFYSETPMFKEADGKVYCAKGDLAHQESSSAYDPHYIIAAEEVDNVIYLDMLSRSIGEVQPDIKRLTLERTEQGYRLPSAY
ncbi:MAG: hypothetical protein IJ225_00500 [Solobacterium sp.]|nr:hypothetical protein [Solobacterium sp.]